LLFITVSSAGKVLLHHFSPTPLLRFVVDLLWICCTTQMHNKSK